MSLLRLFPLLLIGLLLCDPTLAQTELSRSERAAVTGVGRLNFVVGVPMGSFYDNVDRLGYGGSLFGGARFGNAPLVVGMDLGFLVYGRSVDTVPFSSTVGPRVLVDVVTTNNILEPHLVLRLQPTNGVVRPYLDGLFGMKYLFTETRVRDEDRSDNEDIASTTNFSDLTWSGGVGAGFDLRVYRGPEKKDLRAVSIHLGVQYLAGGRAEYLAEGSLEDTNNNGELDEEELNIQRSMTTLIQPQIGVTVEF